MSDEFPDDRCDDLTPIESAKELRQMVRRGRQRIEEMELERERFVDHIADLQMQIDRLHRLVSR